MPLVRDTQRLASRFIGILDRRIDFQLRRRLDQFRIGEVIQLDYGTKTAAIDFGEGATSNIRFSLTNAIHAGDTVRVVTQPNGQRWVVDNISSPKLVGTARLRTTAFSIPTSVFTKIEGFTTHHAGTGSVYNATLSSERIYYAGIYLIRVRTAFTSNATGRRIIGFTMGAGWNVDPGSSPALLDRKSENAVSGGDHYIEMSRMVYLAADTNVSVTAWQNSGAALDASNTELQIARLGS